MPAGRRSCWAKLPDPPLIVSSTPRTMHNFQPEPVTGMSETAILTRVRAFIQDNFLYMLPDFVLEDDDSLMEKGVVDSMGVAEVLAFLEEEFGVNIADDEI